MTDPLGGVTAYTYDLNANMTAQTDPLSHITSYGYDELGRPISEKIDDGAGAFLIERGYRFDKAGNLLKDINGEGTISYGYDDVYNLTAITDRQGSTYTYTYDANQNQLTGREDTTGKTVAFSYNSLGLMSQVTDVHGAQQSFSYDAAGNLSQRDDIVAGQSFTTTYGYTPRNQMQSVSRGGATTSYSYDAAGRLIQMSYPAQPDPILTSYGYDAAGRLTSQQSTRAGQVLLGYSQSYDPSGNIVSLTRAAGGTTTYAYDALDRLTAENIPGLGLTTYSYDAAGNRATKNAPTEGLTNYYYNPANQLTAAVDSEATSYSYDAAGRLSQKTRGAATTTLTYNGLDKLIGVDTTTGAVNYSYDPLGRRVARSEGTNINNYHLSGATDMTAYNSDATGALTTALISGADGLVSLTAYGGGDPFTAYQLFNPHGDSEAITDTGGNVLYSSTWDAFGNPVTGGGLSYGYSAKYLRESDYLTGCTRMGVREYDPTAGRFTSVDPLKGDPYNPQQRNRYQYTGNNPLVRYDLNGMWWGGDAWGWVEDKATGFGSGVKMTVVGSWNDFQKGGFDALSDDYWQGYYSMPTWAQYVDTGVIIGGFTFLDLYSMGAFTPVQGGYTSELLSEEGSIGLGRGATCGNTIKGGRAPDFVVSSDGTAFPVPKGAQGPQPVFNAAGRQTGTAFTGGSGGANGQVDTMRLMNSTPPRGESPGYPNGYIKYENAAGQGVDPYSGQTLPNSISHFPIS